jgi:hypothetical protein
MTPAQMARRRTALKNQIKDLQAELDTLDNALKPIAQAAFGPGTSQTTAERDGIRIIRRKLRTDLRSSDPRATARYLATLDADVLSPSLVSKSKLDKLDPVFSDGAVLLAGDPIPGLKASPVWSFEFEPVTPATITVGDLL